MSNAEQLLTLQELDTALDQLRHRRATLAERARLGAVADALDGLARTRREIEAQRDELAARQRRLEDEIGMVTEKAKQADRTLYSGTVSAPRELQALQDEIDALGRRQRVLEDQDLEVMEELEPVEAELRDLDGREGDLDAEAAALRAAIAEAEAEIDAEIAGRESTRGEAAGGIPAEVLAEYEQLRSRLGGVGVARLVGHNCGGCHLALSAVEIDRIRRLPPDAMVHCEECGRLLVRVSP